MPRLDSIGAKREKGTIVNLSSHPDASPFDHKFMSPTYEERLQRHIRNYLNTQGKML